MYICVNDPLLTGTWKSMNSHTFGTKFYKARLHSSLNNTSVLTSPCMGQTLPPTTDVG